MISPHFATSSLFDAPKAELENPLVLVVAEDISRMEQLVPFLDHAAKEGRFLLIAATKVTEQVITYLLVNKSFGKSRVCVISSPQDPIAQLDIIEDLASLTGSLVVGMKAGLPLERVDISSSPPHLE